MIQRDYKINIEKDRFIINLLGEIYWGLQVENFEKKLKQKKEVVEMLLERLLREEKSGITETYLSPSEIEIIKKALKAVENEIEEREISTRIGTSLTEVKKIAIFN